MYYLYHHSTSAKCMSVEVKGMTAAVGLNCRLIVVFKVTAAVGLDLG